MKKALFAICLGVVAFANNANELKIYEQILSSLKTEEIPKFIKQLAGQNLPYRVDEMVVIDSLDIDGLNVNANFKLNDTANRKISNLKKAQVARLKNEFYQNGKSAICATSIAKVMLKRGIKLNGSYTLNNKHLFDISVDKSSCE
ncbi:hypothetical protein CCAL9344_04040 [Campylobacter sp. RM9344]|uniref:Uncharacterized protein n=1 Tax=Campylobacter californiensis TaxID=1032243 RepID=A0AAW3ZUI7_9BACT|nr:MULTISPECIES: hypothetical protein [unclassified Campylobacter]MBE2984919.1 hypothetical protein [Campylobacter sp. RM6883]MBE2986352.1 hypothetical protein [Campylobacter sp. RM12919]MBE2988017.1 hypothetical protein [Campylobacter sp. RM12920]MBE2995305.1 hypothetical protein [Campylobacter sp. RM6913]MBE3029360.1 hypothetical protein [Campylobacter sp. RM9344]